jgi:hypothetical protein
MEILVVLQLLFCYNYTVLFLFQLSNQATGWQNVVENGLSK